MPTLITHYLNLHKKYGLPQAQWRLWCKIGKTRPDREEIIIGSILTQNTSWGNVEKAITNLKHEKLLSLRKIAMCSGARLAPIIREAGFHNQKAEYLKNVAKFFVASGGVKGLMKQETMALRKELLALKGVGPETADSILLYACDLPKFVIDEYTRRFVKKTRLTKNLDYQYLQKYFEDRLDRNVKLWQDFHALIVISGKNKI